MSKNTIIIDELTNLEYPPCFTSHAKCAKCKSFGGACTDRINDIDRLRYELGELTDLR